MIILLIDSKKGSLKHGLIMTNEEENVIKATNCPRLFSFTSLDSRFSLDAYLSENQMLEIIFSDYKKKRFIYQTLCEVFIEQEQPYKLEIYFCAESGKLSVKLNERSTYTLEESFCSVLEKFSYFT